MVPSTADGLLSPDRAAAAAVAKCEELAAVADELREALTDLVAAVGYHPAAAHTGLAVGTLQLWVTRVPPSKTLAAARQRRNS